jgi:prolyl-tRNA synthetase
MWCAGKCARGSFCAPEFLWQEGHTAHATREEAMDETERMLEVYPFRRGVAGHARGDQGVKTASERFAGAEETYCIEAMMQDGKSLQAGTSHFLGQNFAKAFDVLFTNKENQQEHVWATSWGVSTRLMGALIMTHSDDRGLVLPPKLAPVQVAMVPIAKNAEQLAAINAFAAPLAEALRAKGISVKFDNDDTKKPGWKFAEYEFKGYPVRIAIGPRDMENGTVELARRDTLEKQVMQAADIADKVEHLLEAIQDNLYQQGAHHARGEYPCRGQLRGVQGPHRPRGLHPGPLGRHGRRPKSA